jgi:hypothetical protein
MLENFDVFIVALAPTLRSAQNLLKKIVSTSQLGTSKIRLGMCPATLVESYLKLLGEILQKLL